MDYLGGKILFLFTRGKASDLEEDSSADKSDNDGYAECANESESSDLSENAENIECDKLLGIPDDLFFIFQENLCNI